MRPQEEPNNDGETADSLDTAGRNLINTLNKLQQEVQKSIMLWIGFTVGVAATAPMAYNYGKLVVSTERLVVNAERMDQKTTEQGVALDKLKKGMEVRSSEIDSTIDEQEQEENPE